MQFEQLDAQRLRRLLVGLRVLHMRLACRFEPRRPVDDDVAGGRIGFGMDGGGELADFSGKHGQVDGARGSHFGLRLDGAHGAAHAVQPVGQALTQRPQLATVVRQIVQAFIEDGHGVEHPLDIAMQMHGRRFRPFGAGRRHRHQMAGEIAAVDR